MLRELLALARTTFALFAFEVRHAARVASRRLVVLLVAAALLVSGVFLAVTALGLWLGALMGSTWAGFAVMAAAALLIGIGGTLWAVGSFKNRRDLRFPETRARIERDLEWLDRQLADGDATETSSPD